MTQQTIIPIIRTGKIIDKCLKGKGEIPTLVIKEQNGGKIAVPINSGSDIDEDFKIGQEVRIRIEKIPHRVFEIEEPEAVPIAESEIKQPENGVFCLLNVPEELKGKDAVCQGCPSLKEKDTSEGKEAYCELTAIAAEVAQVTASTEAPTETVTQPESTESAEDPR